MMFIQFVVSLFATLSFAVLFSAPKVELVFCGITGALGWIVYLACLGANTGKPIANLIAALTLTLVARFFSAARKNPPPSICSVGYSHWFQVRAFTIPRIILS